MPDTKQVKQIRAIKERLQKQLNPFAQKPENFVTLPNC